MWGGVAAGGWCAGLELAWEARCLGLLGAAVEGPCPGGLLGCGSRDRDLPAHVTGEGGVTYGSFVGNQN